MSYSSTNLFQYRHCSSIQYQGKDLDIGRRRGAEVSEWVIEQEQRLSISGSWSPESHIPLDLAVCGPRVSPFTHNVSQRAATSDM